MATRRTILWTVLTGILLLFVGSQATLVAPMTWASLSPRHAVRVLAAASAFAFGPGGKALASIARDRVILRDVNSGRVRYAFPNAGDAVASVAYSPTGTLVAGVTQAAQIILWDADTGFRRAALSGHRDAISALAFSPDGRLLASGGRDGQIVVWDVTSGLAHVALAAGNDAVTALTFSPDGQTLASGSRAAAIRFWNPQSGQLKGQLREASGRSVSAIVFSPDGATLASIADSTRVTLWDMNTGAASRVLVRDGGVINAIAFSPDASVLASGSQDGRIALWDVASGDMRGSLRSALTAPITEIAFGFDGRTLAASGIDTRIAVWDLMAMRLDHLLVGHSDVVADLAFMPEDGGLASVARNGELIRWDLATGRPQQPIAQFLARVESGQGAGGTNTVGVPGTV